MRIKHYLAAAVLLAMPNAAMAQETPEGEPRPEPEVMPEETPAQKAPAAETKMHAEVKGAVLPAAVGIESAKMSARALEELARTESVRSKDVRKTAEIAEESIEDAQESIKRLRDVKGLSDDATRSVGMASNSLEQARDTVKRIERQVGEVEGVFRKDKAENIRKDVQQLDKQLADARDSLESAAEAYRIETDFSQAM